VKTDRIDVEKLLRTLIAWCRGARHICSMVVIPACIAPQTGAPLVRWQMRQWQ
jgi:hypothetical protein